MPIEDDNRIRALLAEGRISALTMDTSIFDEKKQLASPALQALVSLKDMPVSFVLSETVAREVRGHLLANGENALREAKKAIGQALATFETKSPTRAELLSYITGERSAEEAAKQRLDTFLTDTGCEVIDDGALVEIAAVYERYFTGGAPFGPGKKKNEFPDALALLALERSAKDRNTGFIVVSKDNDWRAFCAQSERLYHIPEIEKALGLVRAAPLGLRASIISWMADGKEGRLEIRQQVESHLERIDFNVTANPTSGEVEAIAWAPELKVITWPEDDDVDIIDFDNSGKNGVWQVTVSVSLGLDVKVPVELNFTVWDSIDRESIGMGSRDIDVEETLNVRLTIKLTVKDQGSASEEIVCDESELDMQFHEIYLGEVEIFEPEGYHWEMG